MLSLMRKGDGYESGAPLEACRSLSPNHIPHLPQDPSVSPSPYIIEISGSKSEEHQEDFSSKVYEYLFVGQLF